MVRIPGFHPGGPGSIPGMGRFLLDKRGNGIYETGILVSMPVFDAGNLGSIPRRGGSSSSLYSVTSLGDDFNRCRLFH